MQKGGRRRQGLADVAATGAYARNLDAMSKFLDRKVAGMGLSDRVWKPCRWIAAAAGVLPSIRGCHPDEARTR